jgi:uncharacterized protein YdcH (DUF465 family)
MKDVRLIYESLLNEHRKIQNEISDIKANSFELNQEEKRKVQELEKRQVQLMNQMRVLFNSKNG